MSKVVYLALVVGGRGEGVVGVVIIITDGLVGGWKQLPQAHVVC
jgi:hypothetical protein